MNDRFIQKESIFKVGRVISIEGRTVKVIVNKNKNTSHLLYEGELLKNISVGGYIKIIKGFIRIIGKVDGEFTNEDKIIANKEYKNEKDTINRILTVSLVGYIEDGEFERGIKELPLIDNECYILEKKEFESIHNFIKDGDISIEIGKLSLENNTPVRVGINSLFASHIGIFGNTGSGKSYTLAKLYRQLFLKFSDKGTFLKNSHFFFLDFNGEYVPDDAIIDKKYKNIYRLSTHNQNGLDKYPISESQIQDTTFWSIILDATEKTQRPFLKRAIDNTYFKSIIDQPELFKKYIVDLFKQTWIDGKGILYGELKNFLKEIQEDCCANADVVISQLNSHVRVFTKNYSPDDIYTISSNNTWIYYKNNPQSFDSIIETIDITPTKDTIIKYKLAIILKYFDEVASGYQNQEHLAPLIKRLEKRIDDLRKVIEVSSIENTSEKKEETLKNITIVSLRDVNLEMRKMLPLLICKELYDSHKKNGKLSYLNIIIDEAHNILSRDSDRESESWKDYRLETFEEIIKEGRKFGVFLTIASQRPSDISGTIISQLHNFFLHRLINNKDIEAIEKSISYLDKVSFEYLPILPTGTCIMTGVMVNMPVVININQIEESRFEPDNKTLDLVKLWGMDKSTTT
ncbi:MAG: ATP-binding protein [Bacteroidales bacterium]